MMRRRRYTSTAPQPSLLPPPTAEQKWEYYEKKKAVIAEADTHFCKCGHNKNNHPRVSPRYAESFSMTYGLLHGNRECIGEEVIAGMPEPRKPCDCPAWLEDTR